MVSKVEDQNEIVSSIGMLDNVSLIPKEFLRSDEIGLIDYVSIINNELVN